MPVHREDQPRFRPGFVHRNSHQAGTYNRHQAQAHLATGLKPRGGLNNLRISVSYLQALIKSTGQFSSVGGAPLGRSQNTVQRHQHDRQAAHDERERKNSDYRKILLIELAKSFDFVPA